MEESWLELLKAGGAFLHTAQRHREGWGCPRASELAEQGRGHFSGTAAQTQGREMGTALSTGLGNERMEREGGYMGRWRECAGPGRGKQTSSQVDTVTGHSPCDAGQSTLPGWTRLPHL